MSEEIELTLLKEIEQLKIKILNIGNYSAYLKSLV